MWFNLRYIKHHRIKECLAYWNSDNSALQAMASDIYIAGFVVNYGIFNTKYNNLL